MEKGQLFPHLLHWSGWFAAFFWFFWIFLFANKFEKKGACPLKRIFKMVVLPIGITLFRKWILAIFSLVFFFVRRYPPCEWPGMWVLSIDTHLVFHSCLVVMYFASWFCSRIVCPLRWLPFLCKTRPGIPWKWVNQNHIHDLRKILFLPFYFFWTYIWFSQFSFDSMYANMFLRRFACTLSKGYPARVWTVLYCKQ